MKSLHLCIYCCANTAAALAAHDICIRKSIKLLLFICFSLSFSPAIFPHSNFPFPIDFLPFQYNVLASDCCCIAIMNGAATSVVDREKIVHHISVTRNEQQQLHLQLIIVDRYEYNEHSTRLMEYLRSSVLNELYKSKCIKHSAAI